MYKEKGREMELEYDVEGDRWWVQLKGFKAGNYDFYLKIGNIGHEISVEIKGGLKERQLL